METKDKKTALKAWLFKRLRNSNQLRMILTGFVVLIGYGVVYMPLSNDIADTRATLLAAQKRLRLTKEIESLRAEYKQCQPRLSEKPDPNEWVQYVLGDLRTRPVNLRTVDFRPVRDVGPYKAIVLRIELEGSFQNLQAFLSWLETNKRFFRVDGLNIATTKGQNLVMELAIMGMMG